jgi:hypothetical protein
VLEIPHQSSKERLHLHAQIHLRVRVRS